LEDREVQKTKNLDKIEEQAFNYHNSHSNSRYVIISNFDELRFYIDKKTEYEKFSLFNLSYEEFKKFHLILSYESIKNDIPLKLKEKSSTSAELSNGYFRFKTKYLEPFGLPYLPNYSLYTKNINYLLNMLKKQKYDKTTKYAIAFVDNKEIFITEFLMAKQLGLLPEFQGHSELKEYMKLIPFLFAQNYFNAIFKNIKDDRIIYSLNENSRKIFHIVDENNFLVSVFIVSEVNFNKQLNRRFKLIKNLDDARKVSLDSGCGGWPSHHLDFL
jgi:hypothetical protein